MKSNPEHLSAAKVSERISGFSMSTILSFKDIENKYHIYRGKDCMENFCECLIEHTMEIITFRQKKMELLTKEQQE